MSRSNPRLHLRLVLRHARLLLEMVPIGTILSTATYFVSAALPLYINGKLDHTPTFSAHVHGTPLPFAHVYCFGTPLSCNTFMDWWAYGLNCIIWTGVAALLFYLFTRKKKRPNQKG